MGLRYDFHLHSCLSPCGDDDMTPYNIVNMAALLELEIIALTDHNTTGNCRSAVEAGRQIGMPVIPGMELCTQEEIHVVCLFPDCDSADAFSAEVRGSIPPIRNKAEIYGEQRFMDHEDNVLGLEDTLLVTASAIPVDDVPAMCARFGGFCYPAHIDRSSYSILSSLGMIVPEMGFTCAEVTPQGDLAALTRANPALSDMRILRSSDAHYLENMREAADTLPADRCSVRAVLEYLRGL